MDRKALSETVRREFRWQMELRLRTLIEAGLERFQLPPEEHRQTVEANYQSHEGDIPRLMKEHIEPRLKTIPDEGLRKTAEGMPREREFLNAELPGKTAQERLAILDQVQLPIFHDMLPRPDFVTLELGAKAAENKMQLHLEAEEEAAPPMKGLQPYARQEQSLADMQRQASEQAKHGGESMGSSLKK